MNCLWEFCLSVKFDWNYMVDQKSMDVEELTGVQKPDKYWTSQVLPRLTGEYHMARFYSLNQESLYHCFKSRIIPNCTEMTIDFST